MVQPLQPSLRTSLRDALREAMKARDAIAVAALRSALGALDNAEAVDAAPLANGRTGGPIANSAAGLGAGDVARRELTTEEEVEVVAREIAERRSAGQEYERLGRQDEAARVRAEADVLQARLDAIPEPISYLALPTGTPVVSSTGTEVGTVHHVLQVPELDLFDGIVIKADRGLRFVDRDQIVEITTAAVRVSLTDEEATALPAPGGTAAIEPDLDREESPSLTARLGRLFGRPHWRKLDE